MAAPALFLLSIPCVLWLDRKLVQPRDGALASRRLADGTERADRPWRDPENHLRSWAVKGFFLAFMLSIVPPTRRFRRLENFDRMFEQLSGDRQLLHRVPVFVIDVAFATAGYILTMRPLDRTSGRPTPRSGLTAALICYPPFVC